MSRRKDRNGFSANQCSLCESITLTLGDQGMGGVRYCRDCIRETLGWHQLSPEAKVSLQTRFINALQDPEYKRQMTMWGTPTPEERQAISIGESRYRLATSEMGR
jgi:hypothetical protein